MTRALLDLYALPADEVDDSPAVVLEPAGRGACNTCGRGPVPLYAVGEPWGTWKECEPCIRHAAGLRGVR